MPNAVSRFVQNALPASPRRRLSLQMGGTSDTSPSGLSNLRRSLADKLSLATVTPTKNNSSSSTLTESSGSLLEKMKQSIQDPGLDLQDTKHMTENEKVVYQLIQALQNKGSTSVESLAVSPESKIIFGRSQMRLQQFCEAMENLNRSFPNLSVSYSKIEEEEPGMVVVHGWSAEGHHVGEPYAFHPLPALPAKGQFVENPPTRLEVTLVGKKVEEVVAIAEGGELSGPMGFYKAIGGVL